MCKHLATEKGKTGIVVLNSLCSGLLDMFNEICVGTLRTHATPSYPLLSLLSLVRPSKNRDGMECL